MTELMQTIMANPEQITFTMLFVGLLIWTMKNKELTKSHRGGVVVGY